MRLHVSLLLAATALLLSALLLLRVPPAQAAGTQWRQRLQQEQPTLLRLLGLAVLDSGLTRADLDRAGERITTWALDSKSEAVQDALSLLVDEHRLDYLQAMRDVARTIRYDSDAREWPEWTCLWKGYETPWLLQEGDFTAVRAIHDGQCVIICVDLPDVPPRSERYWLLADVDGDDQHDITVNLVPGQPIRWNRTGGNETLGSTEDALGKGRTLEVRLPERCLGALRGPSLAMRLMGQPRSDRSVPTASFVLPITSSVEPVRALLRLGAARELPGGGTVPEELLDAIRTQRGTAAVLRRVGHVYVLPDDGYVSSPIAAGSGIVPEAVGETGFDLHAATRSFQKGFGSTALHPDPYDFVVFFINYQAYVGPTYPLPLGRIMCYAHSGIRTTELGLGREPSDTRWLYRSYGRLLGTVAMNSIHFQPGGWTEPPQRVRWFLQRMAHECGHQWLARVRFDADPGPQVVPSDALRSGERSGAHWSPFMRWEGSMMGAKLLGAFPYDLFDCGQGTFEARRVTEYWRFSDLDLYLMGLLPPRQVRPLWLVLDPDIPEGELKMSTPFRGARREVTVDDIIAVEGPRIPDCQHAQKDFRAAFVLVTRGEMPTEDELAFVDTLRREFEKYWHEVTRGLSTMDTHLDP